MAQLPRPETMDPFLYADAVVPPQYHCGRCGAHGVKLWREYQTFLEHQSLLCGTCACKDQSNEDRTFSVSQDDEGNVSVKRDPDLYGIEGGDQIGWRVPAVPTEDGSTYWGYTSVPSDGVSWWNKLPIRKEPEPTEVVTEGDKT